MALSQNYVFFSFLFVTQCDIFNMLYFAIMANSFNWRKYWFLTNDSTYRKRKHFAMRRPSSFQ